MPWSTPALAAVRQNNRDYITGKLQKPLIPNDYPRVLADANAGNAHLNLQYLDWQAQQYLPDTAEDEWLDRHGNIWLVNADGTRGRKSATFASGPVSFNGLVAGNVLPQGSQLTTSIGSVQLAFQTTASVTVGIGTNTVAVRALTAGSAGNLEVGTALSLATAVAGLDASSFAVVSLTGGADEEGDDELKARVLQRIQQPPMGGDAGDYVAWALSVPGVTRAWCSPLEMGPGTVTLRVMCDDLRASTDPATNGFPLAADLLAVTSFLNTVRPVTADGFVVAPIPQPVPFAITNLAGDSVSLRAAIATSVGAMLRSKAKPAFAFNGVGQAAQTIYAAWVSDAILQTAGVSSFDLAMADAVMANNGCMGVLGTIS